MHTKWTDEELGIIEVMANLYTKEQIAKSLNRTPATIGLHKSKF